MTRVRVRMYRQGLGDCFLLTFPSAGGDRHVLIDCGVLKGTEDSTAKMRAAAENIIATTGGTLAALVVTHEHWDHVSGFVQAADVLDALKPAEAWFAWTEDPSDDLAKELSARRQKAHAAVEGAANHLAVAGGSAPHSVGSRLDALLEFTGGRGVAAGKTTAAGLAWAKVPCGHSGPLLPAWRAAAARDSRRRRRACLCASVPARTNAAPEERSEQEGARGVRVVGRGRRRP